MSFKWLSKPLKYFRLGKESQSKVRPIKMIFKDLEKGKGFISLLNLKTIAGEKLQKVHLGHDLPP